MHSAVVSLRRSIVALLAALSVVGAVPCAFAEEEPASLLAQELFEVASSTLPLSDEGAKAMEPVGVAYSSQGTLALRADMPLAGGDAEIPVATASFAVDGMVFAIASEGAVSLVAVDYDAVSGEGALVIPSAVVFDEVEYRVGSIAGYAFCFLEEEAVIIPASVTHVSDDAFRSSSVSSVEVDGENPTYASFDGSLWDAGLTRLQLIPEGKEGAVRIPSTAEEVPASAFSHCAGVTAISVDAGSAAFASENGLLYDAELTTLLRVPAGATDIAIRDGCTTVAAGSMEGCALLERISAPASIVSVDPSTFSREVPVVQLPASSLAAAEEDEGSPQMTGVAALSMKSRSDEQVDTSMVRVALARGASADPWQAIGALVEDEHADDSELDEDTERTTPVSLPSPQALSADSLPSEDDGQPGLAVASQGANAYGAGGPISNSQLTLVLKDNVKLEWYDYQGGFDSQSQTNEATESGLFPSPCSWSTTYLDICSWGTAPESPTKAGDTDTVYLLMSSASWDGRVIVLRNGDPGYALTWTRSGGTSNYYVTPPNDYHLTGDVTLTVAARGNEYDATFDGNGGTVNGASTWTASDPKVTYGNGNWARVNSAVRQGYAFKGYYTAASGGTQVYAPVSGTTYSQAINDGTYWVEDEWRYAGNATFYAQWTKLSSYVLTLDPNGGSGSFTRYYWPEKGYTTSSSSTSVVAPGSPYVSSFPSRAGYVFMGYYDTSSATGGTCYIDERGNLTQEAPRLSSDKVLYVRWGCTVILDKQGGNGGDGSVVVPAGTAIGAIAKPELSDWSFRGYTDDMGTVSYLYVDESGRGTTRTVSSSPKELYANWTKTVTLSANGGTAGSLTSMTAGIGRKLGQKCAQVESSHSDYPIRSLFSHGITDDGGWAPTRAGYVFQGYYDTSASTGGTCYISAAGIAQTSCSPVASNMPSTLYARWAASTITITWDANGGRIDGQDGPFIRYPTYGPDTTLVQTWGAEFWSTEDGRLARPGYDFLGWFTQRDGGTRVEQSTPMPTSNTTYYAHWAASTITITWDANGGRIDGQDGPFIRYPTYGPDTTLVQTWGAVFWSTEDGRLARPGYDFLGWFTQRDGGTRVEQSTPMPTSNTTYYAHWAASTYSLVLDANGGTVMGAATWSPDDSGAPVTFGSGNWADVPAPFRAGYAFAGWFAEPDGGSLVYAPTEGGKVSCVNEGTYWDDRRWCYPGDATFYAQWTPIVAAVAPLRVVVQVDLFGIQHEGEEAAGYLESRCGEPLEVAQVLFSPMEGAQDLFGSSASEVLLKVLAEGAQGDGISFALGSSAVVNASDGASEAASLAPFALPDGYGTRKAITYRFDIPDEQLEAIDRNVFSGQTSAVAQVVYTVALA